MKSLASWAFPKRCGIAPGGYASGGGDAFLNFVTTTPEPLMAAGRYRLWVCHDPRRERAGSANRNERRISGRTGAARSSHHQFW